MISNFQNLVNTEIQDIKYSKVYIGTNAGKNIEKCIKQAEKFVYIISPYFSSSKINLLEKLDKKIDKKLILCDNSNFFTQNSLELLKELFCYSDNQDFPFEKQKIENEKNNAIKRIEKQILFWFISLAFLICGIGIFFYLKRLSNKYIYIFAFCVSICVCGFLYCMIKTSFIDKKFKKRLKKLKETIVPKMQWKFNIKIIRAYKAPKETSSPYTHLKLYLMDCPRLSKINNKTVIKAFLSSANFTDNGFNSNLEFVFETTDFKTADELFLFFNNIYNNDKINFHKLNFLTKLLFEKKLIKNLE